MFKKKQQQSDTILGLAAIAFVLVIAVLSYISDNREAK